MSGYVTGLVFRRSKMRGAARLVLAVIADACDDDGTNGWPSIETIADRAQVDRRTAQRAVKECEAGGELVVEQHKGGPVEREARYRTHRYSIPLDDWIMAEGEQARSRRGGTTPPLEGRQVTASEGRQETASEGRHLIHSGAASDPLRGGVTPPNSSITHPVTSSIPPPAPQGGEREDDPLRGFDAFWQVYPERNGKRLGKRLCQTAWRRMPLADRRAAWRGAKHYALACEAGLQGAMDPERFLKHRRWEDWQTPAEPGNHTPVSSSDRKLSRQEEVQAANADTIRRVSEQRRAAAGG